MMNEFFFLLASGKYLVPGIKERDLSHNDR